MPFRNVIFDMDDTLIACGKYYKAVRTEFIDWVSHRTKLPRELCAQLITHIDLECTHLPNGWGRERFPRSFAATSVALDVIAGNVIDQDAAAQAFLLGESVFSAPYELLPYATHVLSTLSVSGKRLFLVTKGDFQVQRKKIVDNKLDTYFPADQIHIVPSKSVEQLQEIINVHDLDVMETILIGDSLRDDIHSANGVDISSILVQSDVTWAYESIKASPDHTITSLDEIIPIIRSYEDVPYMYTV